MNPSRDIQMRVRLVAVLTVLSLAFAMALAGNASAAERAIQPGESYSVEIELSFIEPLTWSWSSDVSLDFAILDPSGTEVVNVSDSTSESDIYVSVVSGTYTVTWDNDHAVIAHLTFTLSAPFEDASEGLSALMWGLVIAGIIVVAVVVIVVIVVVMGSRKPQPQQPMGPPPQMTSQALASGRCPNCGTTIDPNTSFCARCGTRFR